MMLRIYPRPLLPIYEVEGRANSNAACDKFVVRGGDIFHHQMNPPHRTRYRIRDPRANRDRTRRAGGR
jgi:hypothetical protein